MYSLNLIQKWLQKKFLVVELQPLAKVRTPETFEDLSECFHYKKKKKKFEAVDETKPYHLSI